MVAEEWRKMGQQTILQQADWRFLGQLRSVAVDISPDFNLRGIEVSTGSEYEDMVLFDIPGLS